jgi:hypothetical protein
MISGWPTAYSGTAARACRAFSTGRPSGTSVETKGPGDNATAGNGRQVEAGMCPLGTHAGPHHTMIGYIVSNDADQTPKPGLLLLKSAPGLVRASRTDRRSDRSRP